MWPDNPFIFGGWGSPTTVPGFGGGMINMGGSGGITGGLLSRSRRQRSNPPLQIGQEQPLNYTSAAPGGLVGPMGAPPPMPTTSAQGAFVPQSVNPVQAPKMPGVMSRLNTFISDNPLPLLAAGLAGLDSAENGGGYMPMLNAFMGVKDMQRGREREQEETDWMRQQREWMTTDRGQMTDERTRQRQQFEAMLADPSVTPDVKNALRAVGPSGMGDVLGTQVMTAGDRAAMDRFNKEFDQGERFHREEMGVRHAQIASQKQADLWQRRFLGSLGQADAKTVSEQSGLVLQGVQTVRPILQEMRSLIEANPDIMGSWINTGDRTQLNRIARGDPRKLAAMERLNSLATRLTLPELEALRPATNLDFERIRSTIADPQMSMQGATSFIDGQLQQLDRQQKVADSMAGWVGQYGALALPNERGQSYSNWLTGQQWANYQPPATQDAPPASGASGRSGPVAPRAESPGRMTTTTLPPPRGMREGTVARDTQTGRSFVLRGGRWVPNGQRQESAVPASRRLNNGNIR